MIFTMDKNVFNIILSSYYTLRDNLNGLHHFCIDRHALSGLALLHEEINLLT